MDEKRLNSIFAISERQKLRARGTGLVGYEKLCSGQERDPAVVLLQEYPRIPDSLTYAVRRCDESCLFHLDSAGCFYYRCFCLDTYSCYESSTVFSCLTSLTARSGDARVCGTNFVLSHRLLSGVTELCWLEYCTELAGTGYMKDCASCTLLREAKH